MARVKTYDVAVIGGGPAGSRVAGGLAALGYDVAVLEQKGTLAEPVCCTGIIGRECAEAYEIEESVILRWANSARIVSPSGRVLRVERPESQACIVDRAAFNEAMAQRAMDRGATYFFKSRVAGIEADSKEVRIRVDGREGDNCILRARAVVIASGAASRLVEGLGLGRLHGLVAGVQAEVPATNVDEVEVYLGSQIAPDYFAWLVPATPQRALVGLLSRKSPGHYLGLLLKTLVAQGRVDSVDNVTRYGTLRIRPLTRTYGDRLLVVGGAAGQVKPTTGGGVYYSLICADIAVEVLHQTLVSDRLSAGSLASYQRQWKKRLGQELRIGRWARGLFEMLNDAQIDRLLRTVQSNGIDRALSEAEDLSFDWHGGVILRLLGYRTLEKVVKLTKIPVPLRGKRSDTINV